MYIPQSNYLPVRTELAITVQIIAVINNVPNISPMHPVIISINQFLLIRCAGLESL